MLDVCKLKLKGNSIIDNGSVFKILDDINIDIDSTICKKVENGNIVFNIYVENVEIRNRCKLTLSKVDTNTIKFKLEVDKDFNKLDYEQCMVYSDYYYFIKDILKFVKEL